MGAGAGYLGAGAGYLGAGAGYLGGGGGYLELPPEDPKSVVAAEKKVGKLLWEPNWGVLLVFSAETHRRRGSRSS